MMNLKLRFVTVFFIFLLLGVKITRIFASFKNGIVANVDQELQASDSETEKSKSSEIQDNSKDDQKKDQNHPPQVDEKSLSSFDLLDRPASEIEILQNLSEVKIALEKREKLLEKKERLLQIAREHLDNNQKALDALHKSLQDVYNKQNDKNKEKFKEIAKMFDMMPPEKAAAILVGVADTNLVGVVSAMKKSAAVIAAMPSEKAKHITNLLLENTKMSLPKS